MATASNDRHIKDCHKRFQTNLHDFSQLIIKLMQTEDIRVALEHAPSVVTKGRNFIQIAMDDLMENFEWMIETVRRDDPSFDEKRIPVEFYQNMMFNRDGLKLKRKEAEEKLRSGLEEKRGKLVMGQVMPEFLSCTLNSISQELSHALLRNWFVVTNDMAHLFANEEALVAEMFSKSATASLSEMYNGWIDEQKRIKAEAKKAEEKTDEPELDPRLMMMLARYGEDITARALLNDYPPAIGRDDDVTDLKASLIRPSGPCALLLGKQGVDKTAITQGLAHDIVMGRVPAQLKDARIVRLKIRDLRADSGTGQKEEEDGETKIYDQFFERLHYILEKTAEHNARNRTQIILNIDEMDDIARSSTISTARDLIAAMMKEYKTLRIVAEMSEDKHYKAATESPDLMSRFQTQKIEPLSFELTLERLKETARTLKKEQGISVSDDLLARTIKMADRHLATIARPGSALDVLESAAARAMALGSEEVTESHIEDVLSAKTGIARHLIGDTLSERILNLHETLPQRVLGQVAPVKTIVESLKIANAGLAEPDKPLGAFLSVGPTGTGKTETAEALADLLGIPLITIDMSNFQESHAVAGLTGPPPGYVGYSDPPKLAQVAKTPHCVLLLDEIEKAHPNAFNVLLAMLDKARLQLTNGTVVNFNNCVIIMSSNLGTREAAEAAGKGQLNFSRQGNTAQEMSSAAMVEEIKRRLPPEFLNRVEVLEYGYLDKPTIRLIALQKVDTVSKALQDKNCSVRLELTPEALDELITFGYKRELGARPMNRAVKNYIKSPLAPFVIDGRLQAIREPSVINVTRLKDKFDFVVRPAPAALPDPATFPAASGTDSAPVPRVA